MPGETFYLFMDRIYYVGVVETGDERVHVYWIWNKWKHLRVYKAVPEFAFEMDWEYMTKTRPKLF